MAERDYERSDVSPRAALLAAGVLSVSIALIAGALWLLRAEFRDDGPEAIPAGEATPGLRGEPPRPRLQPSPQNDLEAFLARQRAPLTGWAWVAPDDGVARIPITEAMGLLARRGWPGGARVDVTQPPPPPPPSSSGGSQ